MSYAAKHITVLPAAESIWEIQDISPYVKIRNVKDISEGYFLLYNTHEYLPPDSRHYQEQINDCRIIWREPNRQAVEKMYALFEQAKQAVQDDPKAQEHLRAARMTLQHAMVEYLAPNDPSLPDEAAGLLATAKRLEMPYIGSRETLEDYRQNISERIGRPVAKP